MYKKAKTDIDDMVNEAMKYVSIKPVLYDQITKFENGNNNYPFQ